MRRVKHQRQIVRVGVVEKRPGAFIQHIGIEIIGLQQRNTPFPLRLFGLEAIELSGERRHLPFDVLFGFKAAIAIIRIHAEITDQQCGQCVECERVENSTQALTCDHAAPCELVD